MTKRTKTKHTKAPTRGPLKKLGPRHERFIAEYLKDLDAKNAYLRAGFKAKGNAAEVNAARLRKDPLVDAMVRTAQAAQIQRLNLNADDILRELLRIATADIADAFDEWGNLKPVHAIPVDLRRTIAGIEVLIKNAEAGDGVVDRIHKLKFWDKLKALEIIAKHLGLLVEKTEHAGSIELRWRDE